MYQHTINISFGDCDPAGIVFYPNYFRWFDATYQAFLASHGLDHKSLVEKLDCVGTGLIDCGASFRLPAGSGDNVTLTMTIESWSEKTFKIAYVGTMEDSTILEGFEVRGLFKKIDGRLSAAPIAQLRILLEE
ncbi:MAG: acyl-CoA thioesterase [Rhizobiaceae bacterium]|nr:acyl-CoA thioesterase [Rhizobiaceae bacterium]